MNIEKESLWTIRFETEKYDPTKLLFYYRDDVARMQQSAFNPFCMQVLYDGEELPIEEKIVDRKSTSVSLGRLAWPCY